MNIAGLTTDYDITVVCSLHIIMTDAMRYRPGDMLLTSIHILPDEILLGNI